MTRAYPCILTASLFLSVVREVDAIQGYHKRLMRSEKKRSTASASSEGNAAAEIKQAGGGQGLTRKADANKTQNQCGECTYIYGNAYTCFYSNWYKACINMAETHYCSVDSAGTRDVDQCQVLTCKITSTWMSAHGACSTYASGGSNAGYCSDSGTDGLTAEEACPECGQCQARAPAAGGTCQNPEPNTADTVDYDCPTGYVAKSGVATQACTTVAECNTNCCEVALCSGTCWQAQKSDYPSCSGYENVGYVCVGDNCAACDPYGTPSNCAQQQATGTTPNPQTGTCEVAKACGYDEETCRLKALAAGLAVGGGGWAFAGDAPTWHPGCYSRSSGNLAGIAFYGYATGGGDITSNSQLPALNSAASEYRVPGTFDCQATSSTTSTTTTTTTTTIDCDDVVGWADSNGDACTLYETNLWCTADGGFGIGWNATSWGAFANMQMNGQDALTACCACGGGVHADSINIGFAGSQHWDLVSASSGHLIRGRPQLVKTKTCSSSTCTDCDDRVACWHGGGRTVGSTYYDGLLMLNVDAGTPSARHVAEVWARCGSAGGTWKMQIFTLTNGELSIFEDGTLLQHITESDVQAGLSNHFALGQFMTVNLDITGDTRLQVSFLPTDTSMASTVEMGMRAYDLQPIVDDCMSVKDCLEVFGDSSEASFKIRNDNQVQLDCLDENINAMMYGSAVLAKCNEWKACLTTDQKIKLQNYLRAAGSSPALIEEAASQSANHQSRSNDCMDPSVDDPESWECDCLQSMITYCDGASEAHEPCFKDLWCNHTRICDEWKTRNNCPQASSLTAIKQRTSAELTATVKGAAVDTLDSAVQGKVCS